MNRTFLRWRIICIGAALMAGLFSACASSDAPSNAAGSTRDSAGITIVSNDSPLWSADSTWRIADTPSLSIGGNQRDPTLYFAGISGVHRMSDGTIAVYDGGAYSMRFYSNDGRLLGQAGQKGSGPGEFDHRFALEALSIKCAADTVYTIVKNQHVHAFVPPGKFIRTFNLADLARPQACLRDRLLDFTMTGAWPTTPGARRDSMQIRFFGLDGQATLPGISVAWQDNDWTGAGAEGVGYSPQPFGRRMFYATSASAVAITIGDHLEIELRDSNLKLVRITRVAVRERPVTSQDIQFFKDFVLASIGGGDDDFKRHLEARLVPEKLPRTWPVIGALKIDAEGNIWAREYSSVELLWFYNMRRMIPGSPLPAQRLNESVKWTVLNPDGVLLGDIQMPPRFDVSEIGSDWVLGIWRDDLDVEHVRVYPIIKNSRR